MSSSIRGNGSPEYHVGTNSTIPAAATADPTSSFPAASFPWLERPWNATTTGHGPAQARVDVESELGVVERHVGDIRRRRERRLHHRWRAGRRRRRRGRRKRRRGGRFDRRRAVGPEHGGGGARGGIGSGRATGGDERDGDRCALEPQPVHLVATATLWRSVTVQGPFGRGPTRRAWIVPERCRLSSSAAPAASPPTVRSFRRRCDSARL